MTTAIERTQETINQAITAFADHQLIMDDRDRGWWRIARKDGDRIEWNHAAEIISLWNGRIFVGGDIDDCVFGYYSDDKDHLNKLAWIGRCDDVGYYVAQKAAIGLTDGSRLTKVWDEKVALGELKRLFEEADRDGTEGAGIFELALVHLKHEHCGPEEIYKILYDGLSDGGVDIIGSLGMVTAPRVIYAWAACRRLCKLIL